MKDPNMIDSNMDSNDQFDSIYKERDRLKQEKLDIQNNIKSTIDNIDTQIRKLKNQLKTLENKKKEFIIEYNKECEIEDRIRGSTPIQNNQSNNNSTNHSNIQSSNTMKCNFDNSFSFFEISFLQRLVILLAPLIKHGVVVQT